MRRERKLTRGQKVDDFFVTDDYFPTKQMPSTNEQGQGSVLVLLREFGVNRRQLRDERRLKTKCLLGERALKRHFSKINQKVF